jgi:zinc D-Ala-D-Ala carboxypeptidase
MMLTPHFSLEELTASEVAARMGIDNAPPPSVVRNLGRLAEGLERVREALGNLPIHVTSGYRCQRLNQAVGSPKNSMHLKGLAADFICPNFGDPLTVCRAMAKAELGTDQIIHEFGRWSHVAFPEQGQAPRNELLTIVSRDKGYELGLVTV